MNAKLLRIAVPTALVIVAALAMAIPAFAQEEPCWADFDLSDCTEGVEIEPAIDVTQDVANDLDSGIEAWWANDVYLRSIEALPVEEDPLFVAIVQYDGTFTSFAGPSPNGSGEVGEGVTGSMQGGYVALVYGDWLEEPEWPLTGYVGLFDYDPTWADDGDGIFEYGEESFSAERVSWLDQYFEDWEFEYIWWGWQYLPVCESNGYWINSQDGNFGDITGEPDFSCLPGPMPKPVITMFVFYSETGFFGEEPDITNTITLYSAEGAPAPEDVAYWAGVASVDDLPADYRLACADILWDDGSDRGLFACDGFLSSVGEHRANLRNDDQGPSFDLGPKIENYYDQLVELGLWP